MLDQRQEFELTNAGDCFLHYHSEDRVPTHDTLSTLISLEDYVSFASGSHVIPVGVEYVLVDTSAGSATLTLPNPSKNCKVTVLRTSASNTVTLNTPSGVINGGAIYSISGAYGKATFKAINNNYYVVS